jgi:hypothetical protein
MAPDAYRYHGANVLAFKGGHLGRPRLKTEARRFSLACLFVLVGNADGARYGSWKS